MPSASDESTCDLSLILACYNEEPIFEDSLRQIVKTLEQTTLTFEIIFVDDGSSDNTRDLILSAVETCSSISMRYLFHEQNTGRGGAVSDGFRMAKGTFMGYIDFDLEVHARYIPACVLALQNGADVVTAHRIYKFSLGGIDRYLASVGYKWLMQKILGITLKDTETGFKFFRREKFLPIIETIQDQGWFWDTESMARAQVMGLKIEEIACLFIRRFDKESSVKLVHDTLVYLRAMWRFRGQLNMLRKEKHEHTQDS